MPSRNLAKKPESKRYQPNQIDLENKNSSHSLVVELTGKNKLVLEIGTSTGYITKILKERGNRVIGVEIDKEAGEMAKPYCESIIIGDAEELDLDSYINPASIDVILLADILEHLRWPDGLLGKIRKYLKPEGYLVISLPNVAHGDLLLNLLNGDFRYTSVGLLDKTHLRFFGRKNIIDIFNNFGYIIEDLHEVKVPVGSTELRLNSSKLPPELLKFVSSLPDSDVYQFVFKAIPSENPSNEVIPSVDFNKAISISLEDILRQHESQVASISKQIEQANESIAQLQRNLLDREKQIAEMQKSIIWQTTMRFHNSFVERALPQGGRSRRWYDLGLKGGRMLVNEGPSSLWRNFRNNTKKNDTVKDDYEIWIRNNEPTNLELKLLREKSKKFMYRPKISILTPVWNVDEKWLRLAIESVLNQTYENWELCVVDGGSKKPHVKKILNEYLKRDCRIKAKFLLNNKGISENSNECLSIATGDFLVFLDHDDELAPFALYEVVKLLNCRPELDFIYSDEDKIDTTGKRLEPFFKPDWSPDMFLSFPYVVHLTVIRRSLIEKIKGFRKSFDGSQDYDLFLRALEHVNERNIAHISKILYHWRTLPTSAASSADAKPYAYISSKNALKDAMKRRSIEIEEVSDAFSVWSFRIKYKINGNPKVTIIIPTKDNINILKTCVNSILNKTRYQNYNILLVDNQSVADETFKYYEDIKDNPKINIIKYDEPFNYSAINNFAISKTDFEYILLLNNDTEVISEDWLTAMLEHAQRKEVGAVGAQLIFPDNTIQHCGVILKDGGALHMYYKCLDRPGYFGTIDTIRNCSAVTAACMLTKKSVFQEVGGLDETFEVAFNDVDYCLKLRQKGYLIVYTPYAKLYHHESRTRGIEDVKNKRFLMEQEELKKKWGDIYGVDPYFNPNLISDKRGVSINIVI